MSTYDDIVAAPEPRAEIRDGLRALERKLADHRVAGKSPDGTVTVVVTGAGALVDIAVADKGLRGSHPEEIGPAIVTAVHAARSEAARYARDQTQLVLQPGAPPPAAPRARTVVADDGGDLFQGFGSRR